MRTGTLFVAMMLSSIRVFACVGGSDYAVSFQNGDEAGVLIAVLEDKGTGQSREVVDDFGAVSVQLAVAKIYKKYDRGSEVDMAKEGSLVNFLKDRLEFMKKKLQREAPSESAGAQVKIDEFLSLLSRSRVKVEEVVSAYNEIGRSLYQSGLDFTAAVKEPGSSRFEAERPLRKLGLPEPFTTRGCNSSVAEFNTKARSGPANKNALPSFDIPGTR